MGDTRQRQQLNEIFKLYFYSISVNFSFFCFLFLHRRAESSNSLNIKTKMSNIILILGAGPNVGLSLATHFSNNGFKTAIVSRNPSSKLSEAADLAIAADFQNPKVIKGVFEEVTEKLGVPSVVVYNGALNGLDGYVVTINS